MRVVIMLIMWVVGLLRDRYRVLRSRLRPAYRARRFRQTGVRLLRPLVPRLVRGWLTAFLLLLFASTSWLGTGAQVANYVPSQTTDIKGLDPALLRTAPGRSLDQNGKIIGKNYAPTASTLSSGNGGAADSCTGRATYKTQGAVTSLRLLYTLLQCDSSGNEVLAPNAVSERASIEYPAGVFTPVFCNGSDTWTITPGGKTFCDETGVFIPASTTFWVRTYASCNAGQKFVYNRYISTANGEGENAISHSGTGADLTRTNAPSLVGVGYGSIPAPTAIFANDLQSASVVCFSDSIAGGFGANPNVLNGFFDQAFANVNSINVSIGGAKIQGLLANTNAAIRWSLISSCPYVFAFVGTNDVAAGRLGTQVLADLQTLIAQCQSMGQRVVIATQIPRAGSIPADRFTTVSGQATTAQANDAQRIAFNNLLRANPAGPWKIYEFADLLESSRDSGKWKVPASAAYTGTVSSATTTAITVAGTPFTTNQYTNYVLRFDSGANAGTAQIVSTNTTSVLTVGTAFGAAAAAGDTFTVWQVYTLDGIHPSAAGHAILAGAINAAQYVPFTVP